MLAMKLEKLLWRAGAQNDVHREMLALREELRAVRQELASLRQITEQKDKQKLCPVCLAELKAFVPHRGRPSERCPSCGAYARHRIVWLYLRDQTDLLRKPTRLLHFAPEPGLQRRIKKYGMIDYTTATYDPKKPNQGVDIQQLPYADASFDMVYCSHVLEHVPDDIKALRELFRVLVPGGLAVIMIPFRAMPTTYEDPTITSPEERTKHFGQNDHLRAYGVDFPDRVRAAGFDLSIDYPTERLTTEQLVRYGIHATCPVFASRKPGAASLAAPGGDV
jgi:SAM-dependent methyltransferase